MKNKLYGIFGVVFLLLSLAGSYYLVTQNADNRNLAVGDGECACKDANTGRTSSGQFSNTGKCSCPAGTNAGTNKCSTGGKDGDETINVNKKDCTSSVGFWCGGCGGFCTSGKSLTCNQMAVIKCNEKILLGNVKCVQIGEDWLPDPDMKYSEDTNRDTAIGLVGCRDDTSTVGCISVYNQVAAQCKEQMGKGGFGNDAFICKIGVKNYSGGACTANNGVPYNGDKCFCGTIQIDTGSGHSSYYSECGCNNKSTDKPKQTPTPTKKLTATPTKPVSTLTPTLTPTISGTVTPTDTPTPTVTPSPTNTPGPTNTPAYLGCGYTPCDNGSNQCNSGLTCITANNSNQYCSQTQYVSTCKTNPGYAGCCTAPITSGPSPTRIVLPVSGFEFPVQALTIIGGITTLLGFLILL